MKQKKAGFSGSIGFVLAAAGSAVGVGNIWRFPYLVARDGGGLFILIYLILVATVGFVLLTTDIAIGRKTGKSAWDAFKEMNPKWGFLGKLTFIVPVLIMTYYAVIGGWILKYLWVYLTGSSHLAATDGYFTSFITDAIPSVIFMLIFLGITAIIVYKGVEKGIEKFSKYVMPTLLLIIVGIMFYSLTLSNTDAAGITRTSLEGLKIYLVPNFEGLTLGRFMSILLDAMSQLFFSLSVSMGIMITYGSYVKKDVNLNKSIMQIEFFDTLVALIAGAIIVPAIYVFSGLEGMASGPGLMFISLPKVFESMGSLGPIVGLAFFVMLTFAAITSCMSIMETLVANLTNVLKKKREKVCIGVGIYALVTSVIICLGYNVFYFEAHLPNTPPGGSAQLLDIVDYISNSFLMPIISLLTAIFIGHVIKPKWITDEVELDGVKFTRKPVYNFVITYVVPVIMFLLFFQSTGLLNIFK